MAASQASRGGTPGRRKAAAAGTLRGNAGRGAPRRYVKKVEKTGRPAGKNKNSYGYYGPGVKKK